MATFATSWVYTGYSQGTTHPYESSLSGTVTRSGTTIYLTGLKLTTRFQATATGTVTFSGALNRTWSIQRTGTVISTKYFSYPTGPFPVTIYPLGLLFEVNMPDASFLLSEMETSAVIVITSPDGNFETTITGIPIGGTAPADPTISNVVSESTRISFRLNESNWGNPSSGRFEYYWGLTSTTTDHYTLDPTTGYTSDSYRDQTITSLTENTRYYVRYRVWNQAMYNPSGLITANYVTLPPEVVSQSVTDITNNSAIIHWTAPADGAAYEKEYQYSLDLGQTWVPCGTVSTGAETTKSYTITNLSPSTQYIVYFRIVTDAGVQTCQNFVFKTESAFYGSVDSKTKAIPILYGSVDSETKRTIKMYGSVGGRTKRVL